MEAVRTSIAQAEEHLRNLTKLLGQCGIPADQWNSLSRSGALIDHMRHLQLLSRHGNLALADAQSERAREFDRAQKQIKQLESTLTSAQEAAVRWRRKLSAQDTQTALEQARMWQGKIFAWLSPAWWRLRKVLNDSYDFKSHAVRPSWTQVLQALANEHEAQTKLQQYIAETKSQFGGEHDPAMLQQELNTLRDRAARLPDWLR